MILVLIAIWNFSNAQSSYFPLNKGAVFTYAYGSELYQGAYDDKRIKVSILSTTKIIDGKEYFISETSTGSDKSYSTLTTSYVRIGTDGSILATQDVGEQEYTTIQASPKVGNTWPSKNGKLTCITRVVNLDGTIKTANKTFTNCLVLEQKTEDGRTMKSYFKEDLGMVATTIIMDGSEKIFIYLVSE